MPKTITSEYLETLYSELGLIDGDLVDINEAERLSQKDFLEKGLWTETCSHLNSGKNYKIEKIFFVQNNPLVLFVNAPNSTEENLFNIYNDIWSIGRPRFLFISLPGSLNLFDLASDPVKSSGELKPIIAKITDVAQIVAKLKDFTREKLESGLVFSDNRLNNVSRRSDFALISDLKKVRARLFDNGLKGEHLKYAHALIGRSIFIRYLEDRKILTKEYFLEVASNNSKWHSIINTPIAKVFYRKEMENLIFPRILVDIELTYNLFRKIANDFNGDLFQSDPDEESIVKSKHLNLLQRFLIGESDDQTPLFLWAYKFDVIPIELISSIYEEFYHSENSIDQKTKRLKDSKGTYYTPPALVEFVLSRSLTPDVLKNSPLVLDPACGSGIFLVETFRRIVRFKLHRERRQSLTFDELQKILQKQIRGIEVNQEAIKITAFSLYIAFLHYQKPPDILRYIKKGKKLPRLICSNNRKSSFNILLNVNSFNEKEVNKFFGDEFADVIIGNPPWGSADLADENCKVAIEWCKQNGKYISDNEYSQMFLWRSLDFLKKNKHASLLVSAGVLFKNSSASNIFKRNFLETCTIIEIQNFTHVREVFFTGAISPFLCVKLKKQKPGSESINYWTLRRTTKVDFTRVVVLDKTDLKTIPYHFTRTNDVWKIFFWGNHKDYSLIQGLRLYPRLEEYEHKMMNNRGKATRQGFSVGSGNQTPEPVWLGKFRELPVSRFTNKYGELNLKVLEWAPTKVERARVAELYQGNRLLISSGVKQKDANDKGQVIVRFENSPFAFNNMINCIKLKSDNVDDYKIILGIIWSSLFRYYYFMTSSKWGVWHDQLYVQELLDLPIAFPTNQVLKTKIVSLVDDLREGHFILPSDNDKQTKLFPKSKENQAKFKDLNSIEKELDEAVFQLYDLSDAERYLVRDRCNYDLDFYYNKSESIAMKPVENLEEYEQVFRKMLKGELLEGGDVNITFFFPLRSAVVAMHCTLVNSAGVTKYVKGETYDMKLDRDVRNATLEKLSSNIYKENILRWTSNNEAVIIKKNEKRLWSKTEARHDVEAILLKSLHKANAHDVEA